MNGLDVERGVFTLPRNIATHMAVFSVGTTREVIHAKTEGNYFNMFVLPTWNLSEVISPFPQTLNTPQSLTHHPETLTHHPGA